MSLHMWRIRWDRVEAGSIGKPMKPTSLKKPQPNMETDMPIAVQSTVLRGKIRRRMSKGDGYLKEVEMNLARGSKKDPREKSHPKCILKMRISQMEGNRTSTAD